MADRKRGKRFDDEDDVERGRGGDLDDEFDDDDLDDELDDDRDADDDADEDADTLTVARGRSRTAARPAGTRTVARPRDRSKTRDDLGPGLIGRLIRFVREVVAELQKVIWPTRKELLTYTTVVVIFVSIVMTVVALLDLGFAKSMFLIFGGKTTTNQ